MRCPGLESRLVLPLLALDVWEHAYYLDYQSERERYVRGFLDHLVDWTFVAESLESEQAQRDKAV